MNRISIPLVAAVTLLIASVGCSQAPSAPPQPTAAKVDFPQKGKSITMIVPWPAGGGMDIGARVLAVGLQQEFGTPVEVVDKPGAGSQVGTTEMTQAKPDGYTLAYASLPAVLATYLDPDRKASYTRKSLQPVFLQSTEPGTIVVKADSPYKTIGDMINAAKAKPNTVKIGIAGIMSLGDLEAVQLEQMTGAKFNLVQFDGAVPGISAVLGGHVDAFISSISDDLPSLQGNRARVLGVADTVRDKLVPDVATFKEQGFDMTAYLSTGVIAPAGVPKDVLAVISAAGKKVLATDEQKQKLSEIGKDVRYMDTADFEKFWDDQEAQTAKLMPLAKAARN